MIINLNRITAIVRNAKSSLAHAVNENPVGQRAADFGIAAAGLIVVEEALLELMSKHGKLFNDSPVVIVPVAGKAPEGEPAFDHVATLEDIFESGGDIHFDSIEKNYIILSKTGHLEALDKSLRQALATVRASRAKKV